MHKCFTINISDFMIKTRMLNLFLLIAIIGSAICCNKVPPDAAHGPKGIGDNGYRLIIGDNPKGYTPGKIYNIYLLGSQTHANQQRFTHFTLTIQSSSGLNRADSQLKVASPKRVGRFQLFSDALTKFNEYCVNTISEADDLPKSEVQVMWVAPATGSGCVALSAMVYENSISWYSDDDHLTQIICEEAATDRIAKDECCACDEAKYSFIFEGIWSNETHPKDYPFAIWLTHFADVIGASHDSNFSFWGENHIATDGFRSMAEWGSVRLLENELRAKGPRLRTLIKAAGLWYPYVNTNTSSHFRVDRKHHKLSLVSMFGPSPDWVVGVNGLNLCKSDCTWTESLNIDLYPWDAGTDNGITYMSPNSETQPRERMYRITNMYPEDPRQPFYNPNSDKMVPLAKLYIRRDKIIPQNCDYEFLQSQVLDVSENTEEIIRSECVTTQYTDWSPCSVTCGKGLRMRTREYVNMRSAEVAKCNRQLISKEMCVADIPECDVNIDEEDSDNLAKSSANVDDEGEGIGICKTTKWSEFSPCSATCGIGISMRTRTFVNHIGRKKCPHITIVEKEKCMKPECSVNDMEIPDPLCPVTFWSDWSPCSTTCGQGVRIRTRLLLVDGELMKQCSSRIQLYEQQACIEKESCRFDEDTAKEICNEMFDVGPCRGKYNRFAYNSGTGTCDSFIYGGCRGNRNNFLTMDDCLLNCQKTSTNRPQYTVENTPRTPLQYASQNNEIIDCELSDWSDWSACSVTCGVGFTEKTRQIIRQPSNGGQPCPKRVLKRKRCVLPTC